MKERGQIEQLLKAVERYWAVLQRQANSNLANAEEMWKAELDAARTALLDAIERMDP